MIEYYKKNHRKNILFNFNMDNSEDTITKKEWLIQERKEKIENYYHIDKKNVFIIILILSSL